MPELVLCEPPPPCEPIADPLGGGRVFDEQEFEAIVADLAAAAPDEIDGERIEGMADLATSLFNEGKLARAAKLFAVADSARKRAAESGGREYAIGDGVTSSGLAPERVAEFVADPNVHDDLRIALRYFPDLSVDGLLGRLETERSVTRRTLVVDLLVVHGDDAVLPVLNVLEWPPEGEGDDESARFVSNLLGLLTRFERLSVSERRRAAMLAGRFLTHKNPVARKAALDAVDHIGGTEAVNLTVAALRATSYGLDGSKLPPEIAAHLGRAMEIVAWWGGDRELQYLAEVATGERNCGFKVAHTLEALAAEALARRGEPLPPRAARTIALRLLAVAAQPLRLFTGQLLHTADARHCVRLYGLLAGATDPAAVEAREHEGLRRLVARMGKIAGE